MALDLLEYVDKFNAPFLTHKMAMVFLGLKSPFNRHLKGKLNKWTDRDIEIEVANHRGVRNHLGGTHAGALITLGETCPGMLIIRNFSIKEYRPILMKLSAEYERQVRGKCTGSCHVKAADVKRIKDGLKTGKPQILEAETIITNEKDEVAVVVQSKWQIKSWDSVRHK